MKQTQAGLTYRVDHVVGELEDQDGIGTEAAAVGLRLGLAIYEELRAIRAALEGRDTKWSTPRDTRERSRQDA